MEGCGPPRAAKSLRLRPGTRARATDGRGSPARHSRRGQRTRGVSPEGAHAVAGRPRRRKKGIERMRSIEPELGDSNGRVDRADGDNRSFRSFSSSSRPWPDPPAEEAFFGLVGDIVRAIEPHSEADPVALLVQILIAFGSLIGRTAYFLAE